MAVEITRTVRASPPGYPTAPASGGDALSVRFTESNGNVASRMRAMTSLLCPHCAALRCRDDQGNQTDLGEVLANLTGWFAAKWLPWIPPRNPPVQSADRLGR